MAASYGDFEKIDMRVGIVTEAKEFPEARKPAYKLKIDFGPEIGEKLSSAQITKHYTCAELVGRKVVGVVNFEPKQIGPFVSEALTMGFADKDGDVVLSVPDKEVPIGARLF
jgi:tRNA-binding protein